MRAESRQRLYLSPLRGAPHAQIAKDRFAGAKAGHSLSHSLSIVGAKGARQAGFVGVPDPAAGRPARSVLLFVRRQRPDRQRVDAARQFLREQRIDHAVAIDPALPFERPRHDINPEMRFAAWPMAGVPFVKM